MTTSHTSDSITYYRDHKPVARVDYPIEIDREGSAAFVYINGVYCATIHRVGASDKSRRWKSGVFEYDGIQAAARHAARRRAWQNREVLALMMGELR